MSETTIAPAPSTPSTEKSHDSVVDRVFDTAFAKAAQALVAAKKGLEASARWLDARANLFGELARKLETRA